MIYPPINNELKTEIGLANPFDICVEAEVYLGGGGKSDEELEE